MWHYPQLWPLNGTCSSKPNNCSGHHWQWELQLTICDIVRYLLQSCGEIFLIQSHWGFSAARTVCLKVPFHGICSCLWVFVTRSSSCGPALCAQSLPSLTMCHPPMGFMLIKRCSDWPLIGVTLTLKQVFFVLCGGRGCVGSRCQGVSLRLVGQLILLSDITV